MLITCNPVTQKAEAEGWREFEHGTGTIIKTVSKRKEERRVREGGERGQVKGKRRGREQEMK